MILDDAKEVLTIYQMDCVIIERSEVNSHNFCFPDEQNLRALARLGKIEARVWTVIS